MMNINKILIKNVSHDEYDLYLYTILLHLKTGGIFTVTCSVTHQSPDFRIVNGLYSLPQPSGAIWGWDMQTGGVWDQTADHQISGRPAPSPEPQPYSLYVIAEVNAKLNSSETM